MPDSDLKYTPEHEWVKVDGGVATVGITDHAQEALSDIVYVELPEVGAVFAKGEEVVVLESTKAAASVYAPAAGEVVAVNEALPADPGLVNRDCYGEGWMYKLKLEDESALAGLLHAAGYEALLAEEDH